MDSVFTNSIDSPECYRYYLIVIETLRKVLRKYMKYRERLKAHRLKVNYKSMN